MSETTEQLTSCDHCWHFTGDMLTSSPPQYRSICCCCGEFKNFRSQIDVKQDATEHGYHIKNLPLESKPWHVPTNEMRGAPTITPEQVAEFQRQQAERERQEDQAFLAEVQAFVAQRGYQIMAVPQLTPDGRTVATWGVIRSRG